MGAHGSLGAKTARFVKSESRKPKTHSYLIIKHAARQKSEAGIWNHDIRNQSPRPQRRAALLNTKIAAINVIVFMFTTTQPSSIFARICTSCARIGVLMPVFDEIIWYISPAWSTPNI